MHIVTCIKQTPATDNVQIDPETGTLKREGMAAAINPFDEYGIEEAVRIKERVGGEATVTVVTMGPPQAEQAVECPHCGSHHTFESSHFGSTACKALYKCLDCQEPFDYFKPY